MSVSLSALPQAVDQTALLEASLQQAQPAATLQGPAGCLVPLLTALKWRGDARARCGWANHAVPV